MTIQFSIPNMPQSFGYECLNNDCFYCSSILGHDDVTWKNVWDSEVEDLLLIAHCPSCAEPMAFWEDEDGNP